MMSENTNLNHDHSLLIRIASGIVSLELAWPLPLLTVGVLGVQNRVIIGIVVVLAIVPWCARIVGSRRLTRRSYIGGSLALLVVSAIAGMVISYDPALSRPALLTLMGSAGLFFAIVNTNTAPHQVGSVLVFIATLAAAYYIGRGTILPYEMVTGWLSSLEQRMTSSMPDMGFLLPQANAMASFLEGAFLLSLSLTYLARAGKRLLWGLAMIIIAGGLFLSKSRGAWIGIAVAMGAWALMFVSSRRLRWIIFGVASAVGTLGVSAFLRFIPAGQSIFNRLMETADSRFILYRNSFHLFFDYFFTGIGPGDTFAMVYSKYQLLIRVPFLTYAHNLLLSVGLGYGILGLISLGWLIIGLYIFVARAVLRGSSARSSPFFFAAWLGSTASFIHGLTDSPQFSNARWTMPMLFALLGLAIAAGRPALEKSADRQSKSSTIGPKRRSWWILAAVAITALTIAGLAFSKPILGAWYANAGTVYHTRADLTPGLDTTSREENALRAVHYYERAISLNPSQAVANRRLGMMTMQERDFNTAVSLLERSFAAEPRNQATLKALGLAYTWTGQMDSALTVLTQLDDQNELIEELNVWCWWWETEQEEDLSTYACEIARRLSEAR